MVEYSGYSIPIIFYGIKQTHDKGYSIYHTNHIIVLSVRMVEGIE